jgi:hypothetical protein
VKEKKASYLDEIGANREAIGYDNEQVGLAYEQEVAQENNWGNDERDAVGRAASISNRKKRLAKKLMRISRELEALGKMEEAYKNGVEEMLDEDEDEDDNCDNGDEDNGEGEDEGDEDIMAVEMGTDEWLDSNAKEAAHPIQHDPESDDPEAFRPSSMGDDEWISIGPGSFDDKRDSIGRASK